MDEGERSVPPHGGQFDRNAFWVFDPSQLQVERLAAFFKGQGCEVELHGSWLKVKNPNKRKWPP